MISRVFCRRVAVARLHTSVPRQNLLKDIYLDEIKGFKPKTISDKEAAEHTKAWKTPAAPAVPEVEGNASDVDQYAKEAVDVEGAAPVDNANADTVEDWFPIEDPVEEAH